MLGSHLLTGGNSTANRLRGGMLYMQYQMATIKTMEVEGIAAILTAIGGLGSGVWGGIRMGKSQQLEEVKGLITQYKEANEFTKGEMADIKESLSETRQLHRECEEGRKGLEVKVDGLQNEMKRMQATILQYIKPD
jgi:uncharacterized protein HemX